jgi:hypothetical protein
VEKHNGETDMTAKSRHLLRERLSPGSWLWISEQRFVVTGRERDVGGRLVDRWKCHPLGSSSVNPQVLEGQEVAWGDGLSVRVVERTPQYIVIAPENQTRRRDDEHAPCGKDAAVKD